MSSRDLPLDYKTPKTITDSKYSVQNTFSLHLLNKVLFFLKPVLTDIVLIHALNMECSPHCYWQGRPIGAYS